MSQDSETPRANGVPQTGFQRRISSLLFVHDLFRSERRIRQAHRLEGVLLVCSEPPVLCIQVRARLVYFTGHSGHWRRTTLRAASNHIYRSQQRVQQHPDPEPLSSPAELNDIDLIDPVVERPD